MKATVESFYDNSAFPLYEYFQKNMNEDYDW